MMTQNKSTQTPTSYPKRQSGAAVLLVSIVLLIGVTLITVFAARVGVVDQRISANEYRHEEAKSAANAALDQGGAYIGSNPTLYDGESSDFDDCTGILGGNFPCTIGSTVYDKVYTEISGTTTIDPLIYSTSLSSDIVSDTYIVFTSTASVGNILTIVGRGESLDGTAETIVRNSYSQVTLLTPGEIPPVMASVIDINGSFTIVADPNNGERDGVPISAWVATLDGASTGSWQTCHLGDYLNGDVVCGDDPIDGEGFDETETNNSGWGGCNCETNLSDSGSAGISHDIYVDPNFPTGEVLEYVFNGRNEQGVRDIANHDEPDCTNLGSLDLKDKPLVYISGNCTIPSDVGSRTSPVILVVNGLLKINSNHNVWGILVGISDIQLSGGPIIHGSIIADSSAKLSAGGYTQVYDPFVLDGLTDPSVNVRLSKLKYSWTDFVQ